MKISKLLWALAALGLLSSKATQAQAPNISANQTDAFTPNTPGRATPGNNITYGIQINNTGGTDALNTKINNATPTNTTLVPGSIQTTPLAIKDTYDCLGNVSITIGATGVLANDLDPDGVGPALTATAIVAPALPAGNTTQGGNVVLSTNGGFTYTPPAGFIGADTFTYTLNDGEGNTDTGTVTINVSGAIWFIDANAGVNGDGRLASPFNNLASFQAINDGIGNHPKDNQSIFLYESGTDYTGGVTLRNGQRLIGQDATGTLAAVAGVTPPTGSATLPSFNSVNPMIARLVNSGVTLGTGNTLNGFTIGDTGATSNDITGTAVGTLNVSNVSCIGTGGIIRVSTSGALNVTLDNAVSTSSTNGVFLTGTTGSFTATTGSITNSSGDDFSVNGGTANISYGGTISNTSARSVLILNKTAGTVTLGGQITDTAGSTGINCNNNTGAIIDFTGGLSLTTTTNAAFTATGGGTVSVTGAANTITTTSATALNVANTTIGTSGLTFRSISSNGAVSGIILNATGTSGGLTVTGNSSGNGGGLVTVNAVGTAATVTAPDIIDLTGGTIQNSTGVGISLNSTRNVSLTRMRILNSGTDGINVSNINGFTLNRCFISDSTGVAGDRGIEMGDFSTGTPVSGAISIVNSTVGPTPHDNFGVGIASGTSTWNITGTVFDDSQLNSGFNFEIRNATVSSFTMDGCVLRGQFADGMQMQPASGVNATIASATIQNTSFLSNNIGMDLNHDGTGTTTFRVLTNTFLNQVANSINFFSSSVQAPTTGGTFNGRFVGNRIGDPAVFNSGGGIGIRVNINGGAHANVLVDSNTIRQIPNGRGIEIVSRNGTGGCDATVTNNMVNTDFIPTAPNGGFSLANIFLQSNSVTIGNTLRADVRGNTVPVTPPNGELVSGQLALLRTNAGAVNSTFQLIDHTPASADAAAELASHNTGSTATSGVIALIAGSITTPPALLYAPVAPKADDPPTPDSVESAVAWTETMRQRSLANSTASVANPALSTEHAAADTEASPAAAVVTQSQLDTLVTAARSRWVATGLNDTQRTALDKASFAVADLPGWYLGEAAGATIRIDNNAGGNGWFIDETPSEDNEFAGSALPEAAKRVDLLTAVMHEMGHSLGLCDSYDPLRRRNLMYGFLTAGERRVPQAGEARGAVPHTHTEPHYLGGDLVIGTLPAGKSITVTFQVTINGSPSTFTQVSSQGTVTADGGISVLTNDPATVAANDATLTPIEQRPTVSNVTAGGLEDTQLSFTAAHFTAAFADVNAGDTLVSIQASSLPANGVLFVGATAVVINTDIPLASLANLNFVPNGNFNGVTTFGWTGSDGNGYDLTPATVGITITAVNDEPTLSDPADPAAIPEDSALQTVNLTGIGEGGSGESAQNLTVTASSDNTALITNPVTVTYTEGASTGSVSYTPVANAHGTAVITVQVQDSGGVAPGDDTVTQQFTVVVNPVADTPSITNATTLPNTQTSSGLVVSRNAADGVEVTHIKVTNVASGSVFRNDGTTPVPAGTFVPYDDALPMLKFTPALSFQGDATFDIQASTSGVEGGLGGAVVTATIAVNEAVSIDTPNAGDNTATEGVVNDGLYTFTRGGSAGVLVAHFQLHASSSATAADFSLAVVGSGAVAYTPGTGAGTVTFPDTVTTVTVALTALVESPNTAEAEETVRFDIVPVVFPAPGAYVAGTPNNAAVTIAQNGFVVTTINDSGEGSLRQAIANANDLAGVDTIIFSDGTGGTMNFTDETMDTIILESGGLSLSSDMIIVGPGANRLAVSGNNSSRVFESFFGNTVTLSDMTVTQGAGSNGGGIHNAGGGTMTLLQCTVSGNNASINGGGIQNVGTLTVVSSSISNNVGDDNAGGIDNEGTLNVINSTISGNIVSGGSLNGAGILSAIGTTTIIQSTITNNVALPASTSSASGVKRLSGTIVVANSIIAGNQSNATVPDVDGGAFTSNGGNIIGNTGTATGFTNGVNSDQVGNSGAPVDPLLGLLADNGGLTDTHTLLVGSPALNAGLAAGLPADTFDLDGDLNTTEPSPFDQRGTDFIRSIGAVDIGAFELQKAVSIVPLLSTQAEGTGAGPTNFTFTVARTGDTSGTVTVNVAVAGSGLIPANAGDFATLPTSITLPIGAPSAILTIPVAHDATVEAHEEFTVTISNPDNGFILNGATATGTITNDDSTSLTVTGGGAANEGAAASTNNRVYTLTLTNPIQGGFSLPYTTDDGTATTADSDYVDNDGTLVFAGSAGESKTITVVVNGDNTVEANEIFDVTLGAITGTVGIVTVLDTSTASTITNDDSATLSITDVSQSEATSPQTFTVSLSNRVDIAVSIDYATADATAVAPGDYTATSGTITFPPGDTSESVTVTVVNDSDFEASETFQIDLSTLAAPARNVTVADAQGIGTITNDDTITITLTATDGTADENLPETGIWRVSRNGTFGAVLVDLEVDGGSTAEAADWTQAGASFVSTEPDGVGTVTIADGSSFTDIVLTPVDDLSAEGDETVILTATASAGYSVATILEATRTITIARNDFGVTNVNDSGGGSLRQAIDNANVFAANDTVTFEAPVFTDATADTITLGGTQLTITTPMTIAGPGAKLLTISGNDASRIFENTASGQVAIRGMTLTAGHAIGSPVGQGGAIAQYGPGAILTLEACNVTGNTADAFAGGILIDSGTGTIRDCTISNNTANSNGTGGGGIVNNGTLTILNSTLSGNSAPNAATAGGGGGAIINLGSLTLENSTLTGNRVSVNGGGGGIDVKGSVTINNTLVAGNFEGTGSTPSDIEGLAITAGTHNLIGDAGTAGGLVDGTNGNLVGNAGVGTLVTADVLDPTLADNGGNTPTHALLVGSPAIDAGDPAFDGGVFSPALTNDQRGPGFVRVTKGIAAASAARIDIGAYELLAAPVITNDDLEINTGSTPIDLSTVAGATPPGGTFSGTGVSGGFFDPTGLALGSYTVTYTVTDGSGNSNSTDLTVTVTEVPSLTVTALGDVVSKTDGQTSLREALAYAASLTGPQMVDFSDTSDDGAVNFHDGISRTITLGGTELVVTGSVTLDGPGAEWLTISASSLSRVLHVPAAGPADEVTISGLTIADGDASDGGGLFLSGASVTISECVIRDNEALNSGAGFFKDAGSLVMTDCVVNDNIVTSLGIGAGAFHSGVGSTVIQRTTISGNTGGNFGGGFVLAGVAVISDSLVEGNSATVGTGGLGVLAAASLTITNATISGNTAFSGDGGGIRNSGTLVVIQSTITGNTTPGAGGGLANLSGTTTISNSLVAGNSGSAAAPDVSGVFTDAGGNLIGNSDGGSGFTTSTLVGTTVSPIDPLLAPLADNGGPYFTHAPLLGSPAIDGGDNALALDAASTPLATDQRGAGFDRIVKGLALSAVATVDIGAYELFAAPIFANDHLSVVTGGGPIDLALESGVVPGGGIFSGTGVSGGFFDPGALAPGDYLVTYTVTDSFGVENAATLTVTVTNLPSELKVEHPKRFNPTEVGRRGGTQRIRITNTGGLPLTGLNIRLTGPHRKDFRLVKPRLTTLAPSGSTVYRLSFKPRANGVRKATIAVTGGGEVSSSRVKGVGLKDGPPFPVRDPDKFNNRD